MSRALLGLGGNIGDVRTRFRHAIAKLCEKGEVLARSSDYETPPWGVEDQPHFINAAVVMRTDLSPHALLAWVQAVETQFGRERKLRWGPRTLDIDILAYDDLVLDTPHLTLPHPHLHERAFVLAPLCEIAPDWHIGGVSIQALAQRIDLTGVRKL